MTLPANHSLGATYLGDGRCRFLLWAPHVERVELELVHPRQERLPMQRVERGYHHLVVDQLKPGARYFFRLDDGPPRPDPASRFQPAGPHEASEVIDTGFAWGDAAWRGLPLEEYITYELHIGTFTPEGTFEAAIGRLAELAELGVTAIELLPVAQFPGARNWGYDGTFPFAAQNSYGGPDGLRRLVDACHRQGLAVVLDVVYNHLGPEGNYLGEFGPYFTDRYRTPWGQAINFDGAESDEVCRYFVENALTWLSDFHFDALRLDAVHAITDFSARPFLEQLASAVDQRAAALRRPMYLFAESDLNDSRLIRGTELGGYGLHAQWSDDLHHCLHTLLTGESRGYYRDFGRLEHLARAYRDSFTYTGQYSPHRRRRHGNSTRHNTARQFVVCSQNHDQVGNRMQGDRLTGLVSTEAIKLAAGVVLLSPYLPLLFMGEEYAETAPFLYFTSHGDPQLIQAVREGRRREFAAFNWQGEVPDSHEEATFERSKLHWQLRQEGHHRAVLAYYKQLILLRKTIPALAHLSMQDMEVVCYEQQQVLFVRRWAEEDQVVLLLHFGSQPQETSLPIPSGSWQKLIDSSNTEWQGPGNGPATTLASEGEVALVLPPQSAVLYRQQHSVK